MRPVRSRTTSIMLALVILASAHATSALPYSPNFYLAIATFIPVLFLALALQGDTYKNLLTIHE